MAAACDKPLPLSHAATCRGPQHCPGSGTGSQHRTWVWDEIWEIWAKEALQGGRRDAFGVAAAWSLSRVPPSCAFLALPTVSSPQHRPATSPSWQESHGAKQTCRAPCFYTHLCRRSGLKEAASLAQLGIVSFWGHASKKSFVVPGQMEMPSWPRSRPAHPCACTHPCWLRGSGGRAECPWGGWWL